MGLDAVVYCSGTEHERLHKRLGNLAEIAALRETVASVLPTESLLLSRVLYSGSHAGDEVEIADIHRLANELNALEHFVQNGSHEVAAFVRAMVELVAAAESEGSPIVFT